MSGGCVIRGLGAWIAGALLLALTAGAAAATPARPASPSELAAVIEARANRTSWADLKRYGDAAAQGRDSESLRRLATSPTSS